MEQQSPTGFLLRKVLHVAVVGACAYGAIAWGRWPTLPIAGGFLLLLLGGEWLRTRSDAFNGVLVTTLGPLMTHEERGKRRRLRLNGASWAMIAVVAALSILPMAVAVGALLILAIGDPVAALVGRNYGRIRIGEKTLEGSVAFFFASLAAVLGFAALPFAVAAVGCAVAAIVELLPLPGNDNPWIVAAAGGAMVAMGFIL